MLYKVCLMFPVMFRIYVYNADLYTNVKKVVIYNYYGTVYWTTLTTRTPIYFRGWNITF